MRAITTEVVETGEKRDARGRRMTPVEQRRALVADYEASGLTMAAFARREGLNYATFAGWVLKTQKGAGAPKRPIEFAELRLPAGTAREAESAALEVRLGDGTVIRGRRVAEVVAVARALRS